MYRRLIRWGVLALLPGLPACVDTPNRGGPHGGGEPLDDGTPALDAQPADVDPPDGPAVDASGCGAGCALDHADAVCLDGRCIIEACHVGRVDLDGDARNGCEYGCLRNTNHGERGPEACNGLDDDCDGQVDEAPDLRPPAASNQDGVCAGSVLVCNGAWREPRPDEIEGWGPDDDCDTVDEDCDGAFADDAEGCHACPAGTAGPPCNGCAVDVAVPDGWVCIPAGTFEMGAAPGEAGARENEHPRHTVELSRPFLMMDAELSQTEWVEVMTLIGVDPPGHRSHRRDDEDDGYDQPVDRINWNDVVWFANARSGHPPPHVSATPLTPCYDPEALATCYLDPDAPADSSARGLTCPEDAYLAFDRLERPCLGYRLPTEAEWEYAARAGTQTAYAFGDDPADLRDHGWFDDNRPNQGAQPSRQLPPNAWGLYDMHCNLHEWVHDRAAPYADPPSDLEVDPVTTGDGPLRVLRDGEWGNDADQCRSAFRHQADPVRGSWIIGARLVRSLPLPGE